METLFILLLPSSVQVQDDLFPITLSLRTSILIVVRVGSQQQWDRGETRLHYIVT
jgi:hypothetical protein